MYMQQNLMLLTAYRSSISIAMSLVYLRKVRQFGELFDKILIIVKSMKSWEIIMLINRSLTTRVM